MKGDVGNCCYCFTPDIITTSMNSYSQTNSKSGTAKVIGTSHTNGSASKVIYSPIEIHCPECKNTYIVMWNKADQTEMQNMLKLGLDNTDEQDMIFILNKLNREGLDVQELLDYLYFCTKVRAVSWIDRNIKKYLNPPDTFHLFIKKDEIRYIVVLRNKHSKLVITDFYRVRRSIYER